MQDAAVKKLLSDARKAEIAALVADTYKRFPKIMAELAKDD